MLAGLYALSYIICGIFIIRFLLPRIKIFARVYIGISLGILLLMWCPVLFAFIFNFSIVANIFGVLLSALITILSYFFRDKANPMQVDKRQKKELITAAILIIPFTILSGYLQFTHCIRPTVDGAYNVGQSTYGDLALHLSIITSTVNSAFPMEYNIFPGRLLSYPFLVDSLSSSLYMLGLPLNLSVVIPGTIMTACIYTGYFLLAGELVKNKKAAILAFLLLFLNGGLGFLYSFDQSFADFGDRIQQILQGYYKTPTNQPEPNNLRWSNIVVDMLLPQRTFMAGWTILIPSLYLLVIPFVNNKLLSKRRLVLLIIFAGALPMVNTHAFLAMGLFSIGFMVYCVIHSNIDRRKQCFIQFAVFGIVTLLIAAPQLFLWTFGQAINSSHFLKFQFNWVNNPGGAGLRDLYFWFYIKNIGITFLFIVFAAFSKERKHRSILFGALLIFIIAELIRFQPNEYDNNKLFYVWYLLVLPMSADFIVDVYNRLKGVRARPLMLIIFLIVTFTSSTLSIARECVSDYMLYSADDVQTAEYIKENTSMHSIFISGTQHINPVSGLAGRTIICGPDLWLYYHGFDTTQRKNEISTFFSNPIKDSPIIEKYNANYIFVSSYEREQFYIDQSKLDFNFEKIYESENNSITIYKIQHEIEEN